MHPDTTKLSNNGCDIEGLKVDWLDQKYTGPIITVHNIGANNLNYKWSDTYWCDSTPHQTLTAEIQASFYLKRQKKSMNLEFAKSRT